METIDIVIPTRNRATLIGIAIESVCKSTHQNFVLWIVDQSDNEATAKTVATYTQADPRIRYLHVASRGANFARNTGLIQSKAPLLAFIDDDCRVAPKWLETFVQELQQPGVGAVFGRVIPDRAGLADVKPDQAAIAKILPIALKDAPERRVYAGNRFDLGFGHGANMGWRRDCLLAIGGFDGLISAGAPLGTWDEKDAGYRLLGQRDSQIVYTPHALVYHRHWRSWPEVRATYRGYAIGVGAAAAKYARCGDWGGLYILWGWLLDQGVRQVLSGIFKWQSCYKVQVGLLQLFYPWVGIVQGLRYPIDYKHVVYLSK